jgi:predicted TIM-barrel fold metal-dependent hydrolase
MKLKFFDVNLQIGLPTQGIYQPLKSRAGLLRYLDEKNIDKALVWHVAQRDVFPVEGNQLLSDTIANEKRLWGCWTVLPPLTGEVVTRDFFARMRRDRIVALRAFPKKHNYLLNRTTFGKFLDEVATRRIPLILTPGTASWEVIDALLKDYPKLTCILADIGIWSVNRFTWPLLETYPHVHLETSELSLEEGGVETTVQRFGARRLVFGTSFPTHYPEAAKLQLEHAEISAADKARIASGNLEQLIRQIRW